MIFARVDGGYEYRKCYATEQRRTRAKGMGWHSERGA
jgi:hypothetical protein